MDYLTPLLEQAPAAWALIRANEIRALENVNFKSPVLDVGCGDGVVVKVLLRGRRQRKFNVGIDIHDREVKRAMRSKAYKRCLVADVYNLPFREEMFNTVFSNSVVEHLGDLEGALSEMSRVLKKRGQLVITVPSVYLEYYLLGTRCFGNWYGKLFNFLFKHHNLLTHKQWARRLEKYNLKLVNYKYYHTPKMIRMHEFLSYLALPVHILKPVFGYWVVLRNFRKKHIVPWLAKYLNQYYLDDCSNSEGGSLLLVAEKLK